MIIIFILLGLGFLGGGIAAIVDGLPYMVLERGFTQVIIGTVVAVAGVVMLALSWVLVELRRIRTTVSNAAMAMSVASMAGGAAPERVVPSPPLPLAPEDRVAALSPGAAVAGAGALAGAGAALAATHLSEATMSEKPEVKAAEPDLFGARLAEVIRSESGLERDTLDEPHTADVDALPAFDPFRPVDPQGEPEPEPEPESGPESVPEVEAPAEYAPAPEATLPPGLDVEPAAEFDAEPAADASEPPETAHAATANGEPLETLVVQHASSDIEDPLTPEAAPAAAEEIDEFGILRESLAGLGLDTAQSGGRVEPSFAESFRLREAVAAQERKRAEDLAASENWMEPAEQRRAPWFEKAAPAAPEPVAPSTAGEPAPLPEIIPWPKLDMPESAASQPATPDIDTRASVLPQWPPHAREAVPFEPETPLPQQRASDDAAGEPGGPNDAPSPEPEDEISSEPDVEPAPPALADTESDAAPAASDEGIVGAYQVGEAHFTIYADGSIQARTPDGDYSFASMDELKIYLASEKSRLGV